MISTLTRKLVDGVRDSGLLARRTDDFQLCLGQFEAAGQPFDTCSQFGDGLLFLYLLLLQDTSIRPPAPPAFLEKRTLLFSDVRQFRGNLVRNRG